MNLLGAGHKGETLRLALLSAHYRSPLPWTESLIEQSEKIFEKWCDVLDEFFETSAEEREFVQQADSPSAALLEALNDDLNTPQAIAVIHATYRQVCDEDRETVRKRLLSEFVSNAKMLGIELSSTKTKAFAQLVQIISNEEKGRIDALVLERNAAKQVRDFATADRIRDELKAEGILLEDGPAGTTWRRA